jgi:hypothetical protein
MVVIEHSARYKAPNLKNYHLMNAMADNDPREQGQSSENVSRMGEITEPRQDDENDQMESRRPDPTRYGDWEKAGRCIDF